MTKWQYEMLQDLLTRKAENNPYGRSGNFKYEEGYKQGILAAKSILSDFYHSSRERRADDEPQHS